MNVTTAPNEIVWTIVVAAGSGARFGGPKQFSMLGDRRVLDWSVETAGSTSAGVVVVLPAADAEREGGVAGGETRSESVRCGLAAVPAEATIICVHDAARPFANEDDFRRVIAAVADGADGAVPAIPVADTIKVVDERGYVLDTPDRNSLRAVQTPQGFTFDVITAAHASGADATDDAALVALLGVPVKIIPGSPLARKITTFDDLTWAQELAV